MPSGFGFIAVSHLSCVCPTYALRYSNFSYEHQLFNGAELVEKSGVTGPTPWKAKGEGTVAV